MWYSILIYKGMQIQSFSKLICFMYSATVVANEPRITHTLHHFQRSVILTVINIIHVTSNNIWERERERYFKLNSLEGVKRVKEFTVSREKVCVHIKCCHCWSFIHEFHTINIHVPTLLLRVFYFIEMLINTVKTSYIKHKFICYMAVISLLWTLFL